MKKPKSRKCRNELCKKPFTPTVSTTQVTCLNWQCAVEYDKQKRVKKEKRAHVKAKKEFKLNDTKSQRTLAQRYFNRFIRMRDAGDPCISCGTTNNVVYCAGHYRTRGSISALTFNEDNAHLQCNKRCNLELSGNIREYRIGLLAKIGEERLAWLEGPHEPVKYKVEDYVAIKKKYLLKCHELEKLTGDS